MSALTFDTVMEQVVDVFVEELSVPRSKIVADAHVFEDLGLESIDLLSVIAAIEQKFGVTILDEEIGHMVHVKDATQIILTKLDA